MLKFFSKLLFSFSLIKVAQFFKISFMIGSTCTFFSGVNIVLPLVGIFSSSLASSMICCLSLIVRFLLFGVPSFHMLAYYIPGFFACFYFAYPNMFVRLILPIVCIFLFILHPVGVHAFFYSFLWFIPIFIYCMKPKNIFLQALACTFVAHAVGSIIWLYSVSMDSVVWNSLVPLVLLERVTFAIGVTVFYIVISYLKNKVFILGKGNDKTHSIYNGWKS